MKEYIRETINRFLVAGVSCLGIVGYGRSGKDTFADYVVEACPDLCTKIAFADPIKADLAACLKRYDDVHRRHYGDPAPKEIVRQAFITHGTRVGNRIYSQMWVDETFERMSKITTPMTVVTDVRRLVEADALRKRGAFLVELYREGVGPADITEAISIAELMSVHDFADFELPMYEEGRETLQVGDVLSQMYGTYEVGKVGSRSGRHRERWQYVRDCCARQLGEVLVW